MNDSFDLVPSDFTYQRWLTWRRRSQQTLCVSLVAHQDCHYCHKEFEEVSEQTVAAVAALDD